MIFPQLIATLDKLPPPLQAEILYYAEYLAAKYTPCPNPKPRSKFIARPEL